MNGSEIDAAMKLLTDYWPEARWGDGETRAWRKMFGLFGGSVKEVDEALTAHWRESKRSRPIPGEVNAALQGRRKSKDQAAPAPESDLTVDERRAWWRRVRESLGARLDVDIE